MLGVLVKYVLSFFKSDWDVKDYPIRVRHCTVPPYDPEDRLIILPWTVQVVNWPVTVGQGNTRGEAFADLRTRFERRKELGLGFPRPGRGLPIELAPTHRISEHPDLARDFFSKILDLNYDECFISDESSLWDFHVAENNDDVNEKVLLTYGVDISDIDTGNLADIFTRLVARGVSA
jgi:hypothetical protein